MVTNCCFLVMKTFQIYSHSDFQKYNTALLAVITMLYVASQVLSCFITVSLFLLTPFTNFIPLPNPASGNHQSDLFIYVFDIFF